MYRALTYSTLGDYTSAIGDYSAVISYYAPDDPNMPDAYLQRGLHYRYNGDPTSSIPDFDTYLSLHSDENPLPYASMAVHQRGLSYYELGDLETAYADLSVALEWDASDYEAAYYRGLIYETWGDAPSAIADYIYAIDVIAALPTPDEYSTALLEDSRARITVLGGEAP